MRNFTILKFAKFCGVQRWCRWFRGDAGLRLEEYPKNFRNFDNFLVFWGVGGRSTDSGLYLFSYIIAAPHDLFDLEKRSYKSFPFSGFFCHLLQPPSIIPMDMTGWPKNLHDKNLLPRNPIPPPPPQFSRVSRHTKTVKS